MLSDIVAEPEKRMDDNSRMIAEAMKRRETNLLVNRSSRMSLVELLDELNREKVPTDLRLTKID